MGRFLILFNVIFSVERSPFPLIEWAHSHVTVTSKYQTVLLRCCQWVLALGGQIAELHQTTGMSPVVSDKSRVKGCQSKSLGGKLKEKPCPTILLIKIKNIYK